MKAEGPFNSTAYRYAIEKLIARHEALRTYFDSHCENQIIPEAQVVNIDHIDFSHLSPSQQESAVQAWFEQEGDSAFNPYTGPLIRSAALKLAEHKHLLVITVHHIICDGWGKGVLLRELGEFYSEYLQGDTKSTEKPMQFVELLERKEATLRPKAAEHQAWWKAQFPHTLPRMKFHGDLAPPEERSYAGRRHKCVFPPELMKQVKTFSRQGGVTPFMALMSAWGVLLHSLCNQNELVIGVPTGGRTEDNSQGSIGYASNLIPIPLQIESQASWRNLINTLRSTLLKAFEHQEYPYAQLIRDLGAGKNTPLVQSNFSFEQLPIPGFEGLEISYEPQNVKQVRFDLSLTINETVTEALTYFEYRSDLFSQDNIEDITALFFSVVEQMCANIEAPINALTFHQKFENSAHAAQKPEAENPALPNTLLESLFKTDHNESSFIALADEHNTCTHAQLCSRALAVARKLMQAGVGHADQVILDGENEISTLIGLLAIWRIGASYLPLSKDLPKTTRALLIEESRAKAVLGNQTIESKLPFVSLELAYKNSNLKSSKGLPELSGQDLAYIIHTSGSTGEPKAIEVEHCQLAHYIASITSLFSIKAGDACLLLSPLHVDLGYTLLFAALHTGSTLHMAPKSIYQDPAKLVAFCQARQIDHLKITPSHLMALMEHPESHKILPAKTLIFGGELLPWSLVDRIRSIAPDLTIYNHYGPAETTVGVLCYQVKGNEANRGKYVPLGQPIGQTTVSIENAASQRMPTLLPGELLVQGPALARGYSAGGSESGGFTQKNGQRLYRTGDLVRQRSDGMIEFIGRTDRQLKINGFRVQPETLVAHLETLPNIKQAAVKAKNKEQESAELCAYLVFKDTTQPCCLDTIRKSLAEKIPQYMMPRHFAVLNRLPLKTNGKIDHDALDEKATPLSNASKPTATSNEPKNEHERKLLNLWRDILGLEDIGTQDDFFDLGGHSIHAIKLSSRAQMELGIQIPVAAIFDYSTIEALAEQFFETSESNDDVVVMEII
ncbi:MAG: AMP-binding protein [Limnobacter sp.]|nr:AMP-binding protein [Limnobacter sp.]